jgi:hypothetical protein
MKRFWKNFWFGFNPANWVEVWRQNWKGDNNCSGDCNQGRCCDCKNKTK